MTVTIFSMNSANISRILRESFKVIVAGIVRNNSDGVNWPNRSKPLTRQF